ncbi:MAG: hypothetical protein L0287_03945 [Anaerolineae bacterium]|nr:hypothetical protein [Anaerolineae bacterium]MCI0608229.1 hypothetical protein [Anaerolineae bacterium]
MLSNDSNISHGWGGWLKWLVNTGIALLAASGSVVAILQYLDRPAQPLTPAPHSITAIAITSTPWPDPTRTQTTVPPTVIYHTPTPLAPSPTDFVISYWQNVSDGRYENAWSQLSPGFRQAWHNNDYNDYLRGYQQMNLCRIVISNVNLIRQDGYSAVVTAHLTYQTGSQCISSEYNFEMWLIYDGASHSWLFDKNMFQ